MSASVRATLTKFFAPFNMQLESVLKRYVRVDMGHVLCLDVWRWRSLWWMTCAHECRRQVPSSWYQV